MGSIRPSLCLVALVACSSNKAKPDAPPPPIDASPDAKSIDAPPDARPADLSCVGNTIGPVAATVTVAGTVTELGIQGTSPTITPLAGATLNACKGNCQGANKLDTQTSDAQGAFTTKALTTGGTPLDGYISMTHTGDRTVQAYPPYPLTQNLPNVPILTFTPGILQALAIFAGCTQDAAKGMGAVIVTDCMNNRITDGANVALSLKQGGVEVTGTTVVDGGTLSPMGAGLFLICNVPPGLTTVNATYMSMTFLAHDMTFTAGTTSETQIRPGY
jgi:hypothetical protein